MTRKEEEMMAWGCERKRWETSPFSSSFLSCQELKAYKNPYYFFRLKVQLKKERSLQSINRQLRRKNEKNSWHEKKGQQRNDRWVKKSLKVIDLQNESRLKFVMMFSFLCVCVSVVLTSWNKCSFSSPGCLKRTTWGFDHKKDTRRSERHNWHRRGEK